MSSLKGASKTAMIAIGLAPLICFFAGRPAVAEQNKMAKQNLPGVVARVGDEAITLDEVEKALASQLAPLEAQRYQLIVSKLEEFIEERLLAQEAKRRGVSVEDLLRAEVYLKASDVTEAEITAFLAENTALFQGETAALRLRAWDYLRRPKVARQRHAYVAQLRQIVKVELLLKEPTPARVAVSQQHRDQHHDGGGLKEPTSARVAVKVDEAFSRGPKDARVTIVEFSDFHCPFCRRAVSTMRQVIEKYTNQVKWVYRDFPMPSLHPQAPKAAEAARCAGEQGRFWEYHDLLFDSKPQTTTADFKRLAEALKLESKTFAECLDTGRYQAAVQSDIQEGTRLGVSGTPTFYINGRILVGAQPLETFEKIIESELSGQPK